ncbi:t-complex protein 1 subunit eta [Stemphylium lycopersici]|nr:t-complex protein 1 subunit eta [Stemphylium lycopersici]
MDPNDVPTNTEAELESFRQKWREEVTARSKGKAPAASNKAVATSSSTRPHASKSNAPEAQSHSHARKLSLEGGDEVSSYTYHDLGEKQQGRRLDETAAQTAAALTASQEPRSALEHYEKAVEKESQGSLGDSVDLYRKAFKLDSGVQETYKAKHYPPSYFKKLKAQQAAAAASAAVAPKPQDPNPSNASATVSNTAHNSLQSLSPSLATLLSDYAQTTINGEPPPTDLSPAPPCPISLIPEEIIVEILEQLAVQDVSSFVRLSQVCKRLAYLVTTEERVWKRLALGNEYGFGAMHYTWTCGIDGKPLEEDDDDDDEGIILGTADLNLSDDSEGVDQLASPAEPPPSPAALTQLLVPTPYPTFRILFRQRPRIRFNGCYISTVNYTRPGQAQPTTSTWNSPIHIVTYFRYLRFLRDGTCISLLTVSEPADVVPYLYIEHLHKNHHNLPTAAMKDAVLGRWRMSGPDLPTPPADTDGNAKVEEPHETEKEGTLHIETPGATPKYLYKMALTFGNAGRSTKNNKLVWQGYWSYNRLTDDWGEFGLKNDRAFYFSRVKSYGMSWGEKGIKD